MFTHILAAFLGLCFISTISPLNNDRWIFSSHMDPNYKLIDSVITFSNKTAQKSDAEWPAIDIILPVVAKDAGLLIWLLQSIELIFPFYKMVILVVEKSDLFIVRAVIPANQGRYKIVVVNDPFVEAQKIYGRSFGYLTQQWYKYHNDFFSMSEYSMILESDTAFIRKPKVQDMFNITSDGKKKPIWIIRNYEKDIIPERCQGHQNVNTCDALIWKSGAEYAINGRDRYENDDSLISAEYDYMFWPPFVFPNKMFKDLRTHLEKTHGSLPLFFDHYTSGLLWQIDGKSDKMSEFNIFGLYMHTHPYWKNKIHFIDIRDPEAGSVTKIIEHFPWFRIQSLPNPKLTLEYITTALMKIHEAYCESVNEDELCKINPPSTLDWPKPFYV